jgi:flagellin FlaB
MCKLTRLFGSLHRREEGITGLETAIILIAFVIVASVFAFVVLSTGLFSAERGKETVFAGLEKARGNLEVRGAVTAADSDTDAIVDSFTFNLANAAGGTATLIDPAADFNSLAINYIDEDERVAAMAWTFNWIAVEGGVATPTNALLESGELVEVTVDVTVASGLATPPVANDNVTLEVVPPAGGTLLISRTMPPEILAVMDLH